jgi:hypothetical protein
MPQHDDFQVFEVVRAKAQDRELKDPPKDHVTEREDTNPPEAARPSRYSRSRTHASTLGSGSRSREAGFMHPTRLRGLLGSLGVTLIRSRGHLSKGEYDGHHGGHQGQADPAQSVRPH